jgi:hypothetical protein
VLLAVTGQQSIGEGFLGTVEAVLVGHTEDGEWTVMGAT